MTDTNTLRSYASDVEAQIDELDSVASQIRNEYDALYSEIEDVSDDLDELKEYRTLGDLEDVRKLVDDAEETEERLKKSENELRELRVALGVIAKFCHKQGVIMTDLEIAA